MKFLITEAAFWLFIGKHEFCLWKKPLEFAHYTAFHCFCGRRQSAKIGEACAEKIGWRRINKKWVCPICCGNEEIINRIFDGK